MMRFGIVTGLALEAGRLGDPEAAEPLYRIATGAGAASAGAASGLLAAGAPALISVGLAGGLVPELDAGGLVLATEVVVPDGTRHVCDPAWRTSLAAALGDGLREGALAGADEAIATPEGKRRLAAATGALAVDMESHHVARIAAGAGVPFAALRVVIDRLDDSVPQAALSAYGDDGRLRLLVLAGSLLRRPQDVPALMRLGRRSRRAFARLRGVGALGARLGPPV